MYISVHCTLYTHNTCMYSDSLYTSSIFVKIFRYIILVIANKVVTLESLWLFYVKRTTQTILDWIEWNGGSLTCTIRSLSLYMTHFATIGKQQRRNSVNSNSNERIERRMDEHTIRVTL